MISWIDMCVCLWPTPIVAIVYAVSKFSKLREPRNPDKYGAWENLFATRKHPIYGYIYPKGIQGHVCPKCSEMKATHYEANTRGIAVYNHPKICACEEYPDVHFHWTCSNCKWTCIMKTADSK